LPQLIAIEAIAERGAVCGNLDYPACSSPFPLFWPFCVVGAVVGTAAMIVTAPVRALTGAPPYYYAPGYYAPPYYYGPR
jgi:hypothetical protein